MEVLDSEYLYYFDNNESQKIIFDYKISRFTLFNDEQQKEGLRHLLLHTIKQLDFYRTIDDFKVIMFFEELRFFVLLILNQKYFNTNYINYYTDLLAYFHNNKQLLFKKKISTYKDFKEKKPLTTIHYKFNSIDYKLQYNSFNDLKNDYGRYKSEKLLSKKKECYNIDDILDIINSRC